MLLRLLLISSSLNEDLELRVKKSSCLRDEIESTDKRQDKTFVFMRKSSFRKYPAKNLVGYEWSRICFWVCVGLDPSIPNFALFRII